MDSPNPSRFLISSEVVMSNFEVHFLCQSWLKPFDLLLIFDPQIGGVFVCLFVFLLGIVEQLCVQAAKETCILSMCPSEKSYLISCL